MNVDTQKVELALLALASLVGVVRWFGQMGEPRDIAKYDARLSTLEDWRDRVDDDMRTSRLWHDETIRRLSDLEGDRRARDEERRKGSA